MAEPDVRKTQKISPDAVSKISKNEPFYVGLLLPAKYTIRFVLGKGGMKTIYAAHDEEAGRDVALAVMNNPDDLEGKERFFNEARITSQLEHPNIIPLHEMNLECQMPYFTLKMMGGDDLADIIDALARREPDYEKKYPLPVLIEIFLKICDAIMFAHSKGIIHLDLKPENIQVGEYGEVLVLDWGLAKQRMEHDSFTNKEQVGDFHFEKSSLTLDGIVKGTPSYMAPEQAAGKNSRRGYRTDIYALGGILYSILTYDVPVDGATPEETIINALKGRVREARKVSKVRKDWPIQLEYIVYKAMEAKPENRYSTVQEMKSDVEAYLNGFATVAENADTMTQLYLFAKRNKTVIQALFLLILVVFAVSHYFRMTMEEELETVRSALEMEQRGLRTRVPSVSKMEELQLAFEDKFNDRYMQERWLFSSALMEGKSPETFDFSYSRSGGRVFSEHPKSLTFAQALPTSNFRVRLELTISGINSRLGFALNGVTPNQSMKFQFTGEPDNLLLIEHPDKDGISVVDSVPSRLEVGRKQVLDLIVQPASLIGTSYTTSILLNERPIFSFTHPRSFLDDAGPVYFSLNFARSEFLLQNFKLFTRAAESQKQTFPHTRQLMVDGDYENAAAYMREFEKKTSDKFLSAEARRRYHAADFWMKYHGNLDEFKQLLLKNIPDSNPEINSLPDGMELTLNGPNVKSLELIRNSPIVSLKLRNTAVSDFSTIERGFLQRVTIESGKNNINYESLRRFSLKSLKISHSKLSTRSLEDIRSLGSLDSLSIRYCNLSDITPLNDVKLKSLDLTGNAISSISDTRWSNLETLNLSENCLTGQFPISLMPSLTSLNLSGNSISSISSPLPPLSFLCVNSNQLTELPDFSTMINASNPSDSDGQNHPLHTLLVRDNQIKSLNPIAGCNGLRILSVDKNKIDSLAPLSDCLRLEVLTCSKNNIANLEPLGGLFASLRILDCSNNPVTSLKPLDRLPLTHLFVWDCPLSETGNAFKNLPASSLVFNPASFDAHLRSRLLQNALPNDRFIRNGLILNAFHNRNGDALKALTVPWNNKKMILVPIPVTWGEAQRYAKDFSASLPECPDPMTAASLILQSHCSFWMVPQNEIERANGVYMSYLDGKRRCADTLEIRLPLVLIW